MAEGRGTPVWKIILGVFGGLLLAVTCVAGGCVVLMGSCAVKVAEHQQTQADYVRSLGISVDKVDRSSSYVTAQGTVRNNGMRQVTYWKATVKFYEKEVVGQFGRR